MLQRQSRAAKFAPLDHRLRPRKPAKGGQWTGSYGHEFIPRESEAQPARFRPSKLAEAIHPPLQFRRCLEPFRESPPRSSALSVIADDGHPWQLPCRRSRTIPSSVPSQFDISSVRMDIRRDFFQRLPDPRFQSKRMQSVQQQQAGDQIVLRRAASICAWPLRSTDLSSMRSRPAP